MPGSYWFVHRRGGECAPWLLPSIHLMGIIRERILQGYEKAKEAVLLRVKIPDEVLKANLDSRVNLAVKELVSMVGGTGLEGIVRKDARSIIPEISGLGAH